MKYETKQMEIIYSFFYSAPSSSSYVHRYACGWDWAGVSTMNPDYRLLGEAGGAGQR